MSLNIKSKLRLLVLIMSSIMFFYQTIALLQSYLQFNTDVDINISRPQTERYPSISVCFVNDHIYQDAKHILERNSTFNSTIFGLLSKLNNSNSSFRISKEINKNFLTLYHKYHEEYAMLSRYYYKLPQIRCKYISGQHFKRFRDCENKNKFIYSLRRRYECVTVLSRISLNSTLNFQNYEVMSNNNNAYNRELKRTLRISIEEDMFKTDWIHKLRFDDSQVFVSVHPSLQLPKSDDLHNNEMRSKIVVNSRSNLFFTKKTIIRLSHPFGTECIYYPKTTSRELCFNECAKERVKKMKNCIHDKTILIHNTTDDEYFICKNQFLINDIFFESVERHCNTKCVPSCVEEIFDYELLGPRKNSKISNQFETKIDFHFKSENELVFTYRPRMTAIDFVANLGGLMSLWLGLSFISLYDYSADIIEKVLTNPKNKIHTVTKVNNIKIIDSKTLHKRQKNNC